MARLPRRIVILGAGGHARVIADAILASDASGRNIELIGFLDDDPSLRNHDILGRPVLGSIGDLNSIPHEAVVVGIGDNEIRQRLFEGIQSQGKSLVTVIHPRATIARDAKIGLGTVIFAGVVVNSGAKIGNNVILNTACSVDHDCAIEPHSHLCPGVHLGGTVRVGEGAFVGIGSSIIHNKSIGDWAIVGGGAVVTRDVAPYSTVVGIPAKPLPDRPRRVRPDSRDIFPVNGKAVQTAKPEISRKTFYPKTAELKRQRVAVYGAGGLGREVAIAAKAAYSGTGFDVLCFVDDDPALQGSVVDGLPVVRIEDIGEKFSGVKLLCAMAEPNARMEAVKKAKLSGMQFASFIHESVAINPSIRIGEGCVLSAGCILTTNIVLGDYVIVNLQATMGHDVTVGDYTTVGPGVRVGGCVQVMNQVRIGMGAIVVNGVPESPIVIGEQANVWAGACVLRSVPPGQTVFGSPARPVPLPDPSLQQ